MNARTIAALAAVLVGSTLWLMSAARAPQPGPVTPPGPPPAGALDLRGLFVGADAARDAAILSALAGEMASIVRWDGEQSAPVIGSGIAMERFRELASLGMCAGQTVGQRHPRVREAIRAYLDATATASGKPFTPEARAKWVAALAEVQRAAAEAAR